MSEGNEKKFPMHLLLGGLLVVSLVGNAALGGLYWTKDKRVKALEADPQKLAQIETQEVVDKVSKLITLPANATPVLATVDNADALRDRQPFFVDARDGDKVLLYSGASTIADRKAYLYRPSENRLVNVAPINIQGNTIQPQADEFSMEIRNGTTREGLADQMEQLLGQVFPNATVPAKGEAIQSNYEKSVLVQVNGSEEVVNKVAGLFNVEVVALPAGETTPGDVDMLLILGGAQQQAEEGAEETTTQATPAPTATPEAGQ